MDENDNENGGKKERRKHQKEVERFMKEFFKTAIGPDTWKSEETFKLSNDDRSRHQVNHRRYKVDGCNEKLRIVWEYDGPDHYKKEAVVKKDKKRKEFFVAKGYTFIAIPYLFTLTKAVVRHYLKEAFDKNEKNFEKALTNNYQDATLAGYHERRESNPEQIVPTPGWHGSPNIPFGFSEGGKERFLKELSELPEETQHQIIYSLTLDPIVEKILNFKIKNEHTKDWEFKLENKN